MEWVLRSPQIHSTFGSLGFLHPDGYHVNENCNVALETILFNILAEDKFLRTYRRCISFGQNIKKDLIPLLIHTNEDKTVELLVRILVNLTIPAECLLSVDILSKTDVGRHTIFEINNLLSSTKVSFMDDRTTKVIIDFIKKNIQPEPMNKMSSEQCVNISNSLLLLRNILHIPEQMRNPSYIIPDRTVQNQILWNIFSQNVDKILIKLMTIPDACNWGVTMVQLIALLYKDQHVVTLHKLLNIWLETSLSESSEDNESNTSPPDRRSEVSSPLLTSDPTSDSSDTGGSGKSNDEPNSVSNGWEARSMNNPSENSNERFQQSSITEKKEEKDDDSGVEKSGENQQSSNRSSNGKGQKGKSQNNEKKNLKSETSDCGYGTQIENQESISTSSNEDELPQKKPVHQKPHNPKQRVNTNKARTNISIQEKKRKKLVKRGKSNIINLQGLSHKTPTDDVISNILKEFTVDFLLKGYNSLVQTLHSGILANVKLEIDTSHFFWLVTYFLKFATQIELDLEHVCFVLSFDIVSYLTAEGVNLSEQFELAIKLDGNDLKPCTRRLHLVVTAIREFVQAIEMYKKFCHNGNGSKAALVKLQIKMCETEELRSLMVLLLRHYNPKYHTKQYLQDLVVTNHILLTFMDNVMKLSQYSGSANMKEHVRQFATPEIMHQYGLLLEDYKSNGEFVNDCVFTLMHHVGGELDSLISLFQPKILKTFTSIWKSEFEICEDWSDLIEYVINTFIKKPHVLQDKPKFRLETENFDDDMLGKPPSVNDSPNKKKRCPNPSESTSNKDEWTDEEISSLNWNFIQCSKTSDVAWELVKLLREDGIMKTRDSVIKQLLKQNLVNKEQFDSLSRNEMERNVKTAQTNKNVRDDEIGKLCNQLTQDGKFKFLDWVQKVLLETCFAKIYITKKLKKSEETENKLTKFEIYQNKYDDLPVVSPVSYHALNNGQSVPLVPWNGEQAAICKDLKFLQLLHKLGFHMPVDTGKVFIRIPNFWTAEILYEVAGKISPVDTSKLKFSLDDISETCSGYATNHTMTDLSKDLGSENFYQIHKEKHFATMVNFTPMPISSFNCVNPETTKPSWLELVQKSQECKMAINLESPLTEINDDGLSDVVMKVSSTTEVTMDPAILNAAPTVHPPPFVLPTVISAKQEAVPFNVALSESEYYNNSACETASVASDLTRMYVSDEDEKIELLMRPSMEVMDDLTTMDEHSSGDSDNASGGKRMRVSSDL